ncbi:MAG: phosphosulfolactate synthase [Bacteroidetes bacterium]|nr:phosphosulfolactate synthase [Bacteroidota bacterium]
MNFALNSLPQREAKERNNGLTMVMDKGLSIREAEDFLSVSAQYVDLVKLGFGTSAFTPNLQEKINLYQNAGIKCYFGGTLFEAFVIRNQFDEYRRVLDQYGLNCAEVSDGSIEMNHQDKCNYIAELAKRGTVLSEVGSKDANVELPEDVWLSQMRNELNAGSWKVIAEARESGTVGIFQGSGQAKTSLIDGLLLQIGEENILWEAPMKSQQVWFINKLGTNVNLGNIAPNEVIPLECLRMGLRGDTFHSFITPQTTTAN